MTGKLASEPTLGRLEQELASLDRRLLYRHLEVLSGFQFCSNDYLGLSKHPALGAALTSAIQASSRLASTGSRLLSGHVAVWENLEEGFANYLDVEATLFFGSGYLANVGLLSSILRKQDTVFSDAANHASLIDGIRLSGCHKVIFPHLDLDYLEDALRENDVESGERFIVVESIFSMDGDTAPLKDLSSLAERYDAGLIVDEAHATGVVGPSGRGVVAASGRSETVIASIHTCGKALASAGAFVAGSKTLKEFLINRARTFIYNTALPPYMAAQVAAGIKLAEAAEDERKRLGQIAELLRTRLQATGWDTGRSDSQIVPVLLGTSDRALQTANSLRDEGFAVWALRPPTVPEGTARLRLSMTADTPPEAVENLAGALARHRDRSQ